MSSENVEAMKQVGDGVSVVVVVGALASWLPPVAALLTIIWTALRIWESETVKGWTGRK